MDRTWPVFAVLLLFVSGASAFANGGKTVPGRCLAVVDGKTAIKGDCFIGLEVGGGFVIQSRRGDDLFHVAPDKAAGTASATDDRLRKLGPLKQEGACWVGAHAKLCAWSGEAEMRKNRDAPYTDFHPLVGRPVRGYCHMGECQWFRYDSAKLVAHNAHEALFEIREHTWVTEHPNGDYDDPRKPNDVSNDTFYARCSRTRPSFLPRKNIDGIDFAPATDAGTSGVATYVYVQYAAACHGQTREITGIDGVKLGYSPDGQSGPYDTKIDDPKDALK